LPDLTVAVIYPDLLDLYADRGNALAFRYRASLRGLDTEIVDVALGEPVPESVDLYILGGAEDATMAAAVSMLREQTGLARAIDRGAAVLGVCAGFELLCDTFAGSHGEVMAGLGYLAADCGRLTGPRAVGEITVDSPLLGELQGFENHQGDARLGEGVSPLGTVTHGIGNGHDRLEGAVQGNVVGTYLHGPALVRNPALADFFLTKATGCAQPAVTDDLVEEFRAERRRDIQHHHR
jgi:CobQ-like glutamine amidotransferase family enzyme